MKKIYLIHLLSLLFILNISAQSFSDNSTKSYNISSFDNIRIHNFNGNVTVNARSGNQLKLEIKRTLKSKSKNSLENAKAKIYLDSIIVDGEFIVFVNAPDKHFRIDEDGYGYYDGQNWNNWNKRKIKEYDVDYEFVIEATLPADKNLYVSTHHKDLKVNGINGDLIVKNHHGKIEVETGSDKVMLKTHHGDITAVHSSRNVREGTYKTHHGDIKTSFPEFSGTVEHDSHHGALYTDFEYTTTPQKVQVANKDSGKTKFKYKGNNLVKIGNGNGKFEYKTHHGDTFISKK